MNEDLVKYDSLYLTILFNLSLAEEKMNHFSRALEIHDSLLKKNQYYIDSYVKMAEIMFSLGQTSEAFDLLEKAIDTCSTIKLNSIRMDKLYCMKAHLQYLDGGNLDAK